MNWQLPGKSPLQAALTAFALEAAVVVLGLWQHATGGFDAFDHAALASLVAIRSPLFTTLNVVVTQFASPPALSVAVSLLYWSGRRGEAILLLLLFVFAGTAFNPDLKAWFALPRPSDGEGSPLVSETGFGFPSGHTLLTVFLAWTVYHVGGRRFWLCVAVVPVMAFTRVYLGVHYPSDTLGGALHALAWLYGASAAIRLLEKVSPAEVDDRVVRLELVAGGAAAAILYPLVAVSWDAVAHFLPLLVSFAIGAALVPHAWRPRSRRALIATALVGSSVVAGLTFGVRALLPDSNLAEALRWSLLGGLVGVSPRAIVALGWAQYSAEPDRDPVGGRGGSCPMTASRGAAPAGRDFSVAGIENGL